MTWVIVAVHVLGNPVMEIPGEGAFRDLSACERRVAQLNAGKRETWYHACAEARK